MKLRVLADNNTFIDMYYLGEPALSFYIEEADHCFLFDTGYSDVFLRNAVKMGIDLTNVEAVILSHGHNDHSGGLKYLLEKKEGLSLIGHPGLFCYREDENSLPIGSPLSEYEVSAKAKLFLTEEPVYLTDRLIYLGEIRQSLPFEKRYAIGKKRVDGTLKEDLIDDDSALAYLSDEGLFLITGCSHSGICSIIEYAKKVTKTDKVAGVIGGFHLFEKNERLKETIRYFKENGIGNLYPCHCVSLSAKMEMGRQLAIHEVGVGMELVIE